MTIMHITAASVAMVSDTMAPVSNTSGTITNAGNHTMAKANMPRATLRVRRSCCA